MTGRPLAAVLRRARALRREGGAATVEFVMLFPVFMLVAANAIEASLLMTRAVLLDRGLDMAVREIRVNAGAPPSFEEFRASVCRHAVRLTGCEDALRVELARVETTSWGLLDPQARCVDRSETIAPVVAIAPGDFEHGVANDLMMVRACLVADPLVPNVGLAALLPRDASGGYRLVAVSAFVQEPAASEAGA